jgi:hypothetical protein
VRARLLLACCLGLGALVGGCTSTPTSTNPPKVHHHHDHHGKKGAKGSRTLTPPTSPSIPITPATPVAAPSAPSLSCGVNVSAGTDLATVVAGSRPNTVFCLESGTYKLSATVVPKTGDAFVGPAASRPIIDASAIFDGFNDVSASGVTYENLIIEGAQLNGSKSQCTSCGRGIWGGNAMRVFNVEFTGNQQAGIAGSEGTTTPWLIVGSQFIGNGSLTEVGFSSGGIKGSNAYTILNSYVADNIGSGIWCDVGCLGGTWTVEGNTVVGNSAGGIRYEISDAGALIRGNVVAENNVSGKQGLAGIEIASSGNAVVENNLLIDNVNAAILVNGSGRHGSIVTNDLIRNNSTEGGNVQGCDRAGVTCEGNT